MPVALDQFVKQLEESGVIARGKLENFVPPKAHPRDAQELAKELVRSKQLTKYQAQEIYQGRTRSLSLGNYTILDRIGAGGMGQVFKAQHRRMDRIVAVKMLPPSLTKDAAALARFDREVKAAAKLRHPNIVAADDADEANGVHFLVMEYIEGSDLSAVVKRDGPLPVDRGVSCILQAARGLEFAHGEGVVHRDIKPGNLLLDKKGTVKILDMGLARIESTGDARSQAELTGTGMVMGTVDYMAPEQALSTKHVDGRADIYSLGCALFYVLTGRPLYDGQTLAAKLLAHASQAAPSLCDACPDAAPELDEVFQRMVTKSVDDRYQSMSEVIAALESCSGAGGGGASGHNLGSTSQPDSGLLTFLKNVSDTPASRTRQTTPQGPTRHAPGEALPTRGKLAAASKKPLVLLLAAGGGAGLVLILLAAFFLLRSHGSDDEKLANKKRPLGKSPAGKLPSFPGQPDKQPGLTSLAPPAPTKPEWFEKVGKQSGNQQLAAVLKELKRLNPGFSGLEDHRVEKDVVLDLTIDTAGVTDISPLRVLTQLQNLCLRHPGNPNDWNLPIKDLSPLAGMKLQSLNASGTAVDDLSPLQGMPLTSLFLRGSRALSISPLRGMKSLASLDLMNTQVKDLSPLEGLPLTSLSCPDDASDLSPVKDAPLTILSCSNLAFTAVLEGSQLEEFGCKHPPEQGDLKLLLRFPRLRRLVLLIDPRAHVELLRSIKTLTHFNNAPLEEALKAP